MSQPHTNGPTDGGKYIDSINPDDPEYVRQMRRPAEVKEDIQQMDERLRVSKILHSQAFRDELEHMIDEQMQNGPNPSALLALQQISELVLPQAKGSVGGVLGKVTASIIPINDIRGTDQMSYVKGEKIMRCKMASCYRLVDLFGWSSGFKSLITLRINQEEEHFLTIPHGLMFHEVTASSLKKANMQGDEVDAGSTNLGLNKEGFQLHAAIHSFRPDIKCIIHIRCPSAVSVSSMKCGLLQMSHEAIICGEASYYDYSGSVSGEEEFDKIARTLGPNNKVMILRNFGFIVGGESLEEAFNYCFNLMIACESQLRAAPLGLDNIHIPSEEVRAKAFEAANQPLQHEEGKKKWRRGEIEFEGLMRHLDNCGYRTGHLYREPNLKNTDKRDRANSEVEIPPTTSSFAYMYDEKTPVKQVYDRQKKVFKCEWLNTPNAYKKEEIPEVGTPTPKTITKWMATDRSDPNWVPENSPNNSSNPVKVEHANQFAPISDNPKEFRLKHQSIRKEYYTEKITAGPQSKILEGITWDEAQKLKEGAGTTQDSVIVVGAASKGIIQRDHQHNAVVYKTYYAPNPFDNMNEEDIANYKKDVETKQGGGGDAEDSAIEPGPDGRLISTEERMHLVRDGQESDAQTDVVQMASTPRPRYLETSLDDPNDHGHYVFIDSLPPAYVQPSSGSRETNIDDVLGGAAAVAVAAPVPHHQQPGARSVSYAEAPSSPTSPDPTDFQRTQSARYSPEKSKKLVRELEGSFSRSKSERKPSKSKKDKKGTVNGEQQLASPTKSTSSGEGPYDSNREGSPVADLPEQASPSKDKKKKKGFRMPSFSKKKDKK